MTSFTYQREPEFVEWLSRELDVPLVPSMTATLTFIDEGQIVGVVGYTNWTKHNVEMLFALKSPKYANRRLYREMFQYPFSIPGILRVSGIVDPRNTHSVELHEKLYEREAMLKDWFGEGNDAILYRLTKQRAKQQRMIKDTL